MRDILNMAMPVDRGVTIGNMLTAAGNAREAAALGRKIATSIDRIYFVGCGAPNRSMLAAEYWLQHYSPSLEMRRYFPAEFIHQNPPRIDERTLVILGSKSGKTPETVQAAEFVKDKPCVTIGVTQSKDTPLAHLVDRVLLTGEDEVFISGLAHVAVYIVIQALIGGLMAARDGWPLEEKLLASLEALPVVVADTKIANEARLTDEAKRLHTQYNLYVIGSGPCVGSAYVFAVCTLVEMQWMNAHPVDAAEFFHGPFEIVDENTHLILMLAEDPSRPLAERAVRFCRKHTDKLIIYDSKDFEMEGIDPEIRPILAPFVLGTVLDRMAEKVATLRNHPLETRRYMWKMEY